MIRRTIVVLVASSIAACSGEEPPPSTDSSADAGAADADLPDAAADVATGCGAFAGDSIYTCSADGNSRGKCVDDASASIDACPRGCLREPAGQDAVCMGTTSNWSCTGTYGTTTVSDGDYYLTAFGCWVDASGTAHTDPSDNCIPTCLDKAKAAGLCDPSATGKACEESIDWYTADAARFGCLARVRVTNPANGKSVIAVALDYGPACSVEKTASHAVLDASGRVDEELFGAQMGAVDRALVHVVEVDPSTPLGKI